MISSFDLLFFCAKNPYYPPRQFGGKDVERVQIVGKVVESKRKF